MIKEDTIFENGTYNKRCKLFTEISIGSIRCVGHNEINFKGCKYCVSFKEDKTYYLPILKENTKIVSEVLCNRPGAQLLIF